MDLGMTGIGGDGSALLEYCSDFGRIGSCGDSGTVVMERLLSMAETA